MNMTRTSLLILSGLAWLAAGAASGAGPAAEPRELQWEELLPKEERAGGGAAPPPPAHSYLGEGGPAAGQWGSALVNPELNNVLVKIPGFIVPVDMGADGVVKEFLLVPYFGACIHVPPPPPNQIVFVRMKQGLKLETIYDAQWIIGKLKTASASTPYGSAAYSLEGDSTEVYKY